MSKLLYQTCEISAFKIACGPFRFFFSDRTCTVLNVEGDAFGAGLLQNFVDRTSKEEGAELSEVRLGDQSATEPEHSPLIEKRGARDNAEGSNAMASHEKESAM